MVPVVAPPGTVRNDPRGQSIDLRGQIVVQQPTIAAGIVAGFVAFLAHRGAAANQLAGQAGIDPRDLDNPDARVPAHQYAMLMGLAQQATGDTGLALRFGAEVGMAEMSILGLIMEAAETMGEAFAQMQRYGRLAVATDPGLPPRFALEHRHGALLLVDHRAEPNDFPEVTEEAFAQLACGPRRFLERPHVLGVYVTYPAPAHADLYAEIFGCPVTFQADFNALELHPHVADWPIAGGRRYVLDLLRERGDYLLSEELGTGVGLRLREALRRVLHQGEASAEGTAKQLGYSRSTLFRRLRSEGTSFSKVVDELRRDVAIAHLNKGRTSLADVAYLVGFSDPAAFSRAFVRWTGQPPGRYRALRDDVPQQH